MGNYSIYSIHEQRAHNSFLEISAELGVAGLMAYLVMLFAPLRSLRRIEQESLAGLRQGRQEIYYLVAAVQASLVAYIVCSCFGSIQYHWFLYYPLAYAVALKRICASEGGERPDAWRLAKESERCSGKRIRQNRGLLIRRWHRDPFR